MKYRVGDIVTVKSMEELDQAGFVKGTDNYTRKPGVSVWFNPEMEKLCGRKAEIIKIIDDRKYQVEFENYAQTWSWIDDFFVEETISIELPEGESIWF